MYSLQSAEFVANQKFMNDAVERDLATDDPIYIEENATWLQAEADYKNQDGIIQQAQSQVTSAWYAYQQVSATITAPAAGTISNLNIAPGMTIVAQTSSSSSSNTPQEIGTVTQNGGKIQTSVSLSEVDAPKVKVGQKVTLTLDAFADETFAGKVLMINTNGQISSGVTTYPATIEFDTTNSAIYPNMGVTANIITSVIDGDILIPSSAVTTTNGVTSVRILKNGQSTTVTVTVAATNGTESAISEGVTEGDMVITGSSAKTTTTKTTTTTSIFGGLTRGGR